jgi:hypothetical protein
MRQHAKTPSAQAKVRIQALLREIGIARQKGICFFAGKEVNGRIHECSGWRNDGELVLQYDHLNPREKNVSFADSRLGLVICKGIHGWKSFSDANKKIYDDAARKYISPAQRKLWRRVENDHKNYPMGAWEWTKCEMALTQELKEIASKK